MSTEQKRDAVESARVAGLIRTLRAQPMADLDEQAEAIKIQILRLRETENLSQAASTQLLADVNNELSRIRRGKKPESVMSHEYDRDGRVLSSRIEYRDGRVQTRYRNDTGELTEWKDLGCPSIAAPDSTS